MVRDDFVDLINAGGSSSESLEDEGTLATVIKDDDLTVGDDRAMVGEKKVIESESFVLKLYEKDGVVDSIDIECKCGKTARIQLEYKNPAEENIEEVIGNTDEAEVAENEALITETSSEPKTVEESGESATGDFKETDDVQSGDVQTAAITPGESDSNADRSNDTEDTNEFQDGLPASVISTQNKEEKLKIIEPAQEKPDDAENTQ